MEQTSRYIPKDSLHVNQSVAPNVGASIQKLEEMYGSKLGRRNFLKGVGALALGGVAVKALGSPPTAEAGTHSGGVTSDLHSHDARDAMARKEEQWRLPDYVHVLMPEEQVTFPLSLMQSICTHLENTGLLRYVESLDIASADQDERLRYHPSRHAMVSADVHPQAVTIPGYDKDTVVYAGNAVQLSDDYVRATWFHEFGHVLQNHYWLFMNEQTAALEVGYTNALDTRIKKSTEDFSAGALDRHLTPYVGSIVQEWWYELGANVWRDNTAGGTEATLASMYYTPDEVKRKISPYIGTRSRLSRHILDFGLDETRSTPISIIEKAMLWWHNNRTELMKQGHAWAKLMWFDPTIVGRYMHRLYLENQQHTDLNNLQAEQKTALDQLGRTVESEMFAEMYALKQGPGNGQELAARHFPEANAFINQLLQGLR